MKLLVLLVFLLVASCATGPPVSDPVTVVEREDVRRDTAPVEVATTPVTVSSTHDAAVYLNGTLQGEIRVDESGITRGGERIVTVPEGTHVVSIVPSSGPRAGEEIFRRIEVRAREPRTVQFEFVEDEPAAAVAVTPPARPSGTMVIQLPRGVYDGDVLNGRPHGFGVLETEDGDIYEGGWRAGKRHGHGVIKWADGSSYTGSWHEGEIQGEGTLVTAEEDRYAGEFQDGELHGTGVYHWADGSRYEGEWDAGQRQGVGIMEWADGDYYEGEWIDGKPHGFGLVIWQDATNYEGEFRLGEPHGFGIYKEPDGLRYEGEFTEGRATGGILTTPSGDRYWATMTEAGEWDWSRAVDE